MVLFLCIFVRFRLVLLWLKLKIGKDSEGLKFYVFEFDLNNLFSVLLVLL